MRLLRRLARLAAITTLLGGLPGSGRNTAGGAVPPSPPQASKPKPTRPESGMRRRDGIEEVQIHEELLGAA